jgi:hypothetical protein
MEGFVVTGLINEGMAASGETTAPIEVCFVSAGDIYAV